MFKTSSYQKKKKWKCRPHTKKTEVPKNSFLRFDLD